MQPARSRLARGERCFRTRRVRIASLTVHDEAPASSSAPVVLKDRNDGIAVAMLRPVIAANEPAVMIGRVTPLAFMYTDIEAGARTVTITPLAGPCTFNLRVWR